MQLNPSNSDSNSNNSDHIIRQQYHESLLNKCINLYNDYDDRCDRLNRYVPIKNHLKLSRDLAHSIIKGFSTKQLEEELVFLQKQLGELAKMEQDFIPGMGKPENVATAQESVKGFWNQIGKRFGNLGKKLIGRNQKH